jgi:tetratricopeptide (TPR) repeat protein
MPAPLTLTLTCRRCGQPTTLTFRYAVVDLDPAEVDPAWDGIVLSEIVRCAKCGAEDDYELQPLDQARLVAEARRRPPGDAIATGGVRQGRGLLRDMTVVKRPSQAIAHDREVAAAHPDDVVAQCRYGNVCNLYGLAEEAERVWRHAVEMSEDEAESAYNLAANLWYAERRQEAIPFVQLTLQRFPRAELRPGLREEIGERLALILAEATEMAEDAVALMLGIDDGAVGDQRRVVMSSVDLRRVRDWKRLGDLLGSGKVLAASLTPELPDPAEGPTLLERMLAGEAPRWSQAIPVSKHTPRPTRGGGSPPKKTRRRSAR